MQASHTTMALLPLTLTILIFLTSSFNLSFSAELCNPSDKKVLLKIQTHFDIDDLWNPKTDCCKDWPDWPAGIKCNAQGRVIEINIQSTISGGMPSAFGDLPFLQSLRLGPGFITGPIPQSFSKLHNLQNLDLNNNDLSGPIPEFLGQLKSLTFINLGNNAGFNGTIPSSLSQLPHLKSLYLYNNKLTGPIPGFLTRMKSLVELDLAGNPLKGSIPPGLSSLPKLNYLDLVQCDLIGSIPERFGLLKPNVTLLLSANSLSGPIPRSLGRVNFRELNLGANKLTGDASFLFGSDKTMLETIYLGGNRFKFDFSKVDLPQGLKDLDISNNKIYGSLPKKLGQLPLRSIDVSYNQLCGPIPTGRRLKRFSPDNFAHNKCLCGPPLPPCKS